MTKRKTARQLSIYDILTDCRIDEETSKAAIMRICRAIDERIAEIEKEMNEEPMTMDDLICAIQNQVARLEKRFNHSYGGSGHPGYEATHQDLRDALNTHIGDLRSILSHLVMLKGDP
jgi:hypothetical protein